MPFNDFERRANDLFENAQAIPKDPVKFRIEISVLLKDCLLEIRRLNGKLADIRRALDAGETAGDFGKTGLSRKIARARRAADE